MKVQIFKNIVLLGLLFAISLSAFSQKVYFSEILYDTPLEEDSWKALSNSHNGEYIEICNPSDRYVDLSDWVITVMNKGKSDRGGNTTYFTFPANTIIPARSFLIIAYQNWKTPDFQLKNLFPKLVGKETQILYQTRFIFNNTGAEILLKDKQGELVDYLEYNGRSAPKAGRKSLYAKNNHQGYISADKIKTLYRFRVGRDYKGNSVFYHDDWKYGSAEPFSKEIKENPNSNVNPNPKPNPEPEPDPTPGSNDQNYILTRTYTSETGKNFLDQIAYFDGLGRPNQTVQAGITPQENDLVSLQEYDQFGRESKSWLPIINAGSGEYLTPSSITNSPQSGYYGDSRPFSETIYEPSPLNRIVQQFGPGQEWYSSNDKHAVHTEYLTNSNSKELKCELFYVQGNLFNTSLQKNVKAYDSGQLYVVKATDENNNVSYEFKDKLGQVVLTRQINKGENHDTYYVYDDFGNLSYVLPPLAVDNLANLSDDDQVMKHYAYVYKYDERNRCVSKKLPGVEKILMVYDKSDRLILSQDGEQRKNKQWLFSTYDILGRVLVSGIKKYTNDTHLTLIDKCKSSLIVDKFNPQTIDGYNTSKVLPSSTEDHSVLTSNYYDDYALVPSKVLNAMGFGGDLGYQVIAGYGERYTLENTRYPGMLIASITQPLNSSGEIGIINATDAPAGEKTSVLYYDNKGQIIQSRTISQNNYGVGTKDIEYIAYNFTGQPTQKLHHHDFLGSALKEHYAYEYDHAGRLKSILHQLNDQEPVYLAQNEYDELGRLKASDKAGGKALKIKYDYNIRSWTTVIEEDYIYYDLDYDFGGNVSRFYWLRSDSFDNMYNYSYDNLSRLTNANFVSSDRGNNLFNTSYSYDKQGNILRLGRHGNLPGSIQSPVDGLMDSLHISYNGNQIVSIEDKAGNAFKSNTSEFHAYENALKKQGKKYEFNANGAMSLDPNKGMQINYNSLNLPQRITIDNDSHKGNIEYTYSASGEKMQVKYEQRSDVSSLMRLSDVVPNIVTNYVGNKVYENNKLKRILVDGGYIEDGLYYFYLADHLGNNRVVVKQSGEIIEETAYYPFGMSFPEYISDTDQPYKYNGKELDKRLGLEMYDYVARQMDPAVGRFTSMDPMAEKYYSISPYVYVANNPMKHIDPEGEWILNVVGAIVNGAIDYGGQVAVNLASGKENAFTDVSLGSIAISVVEGAINPIGGVTRSVVKSVAKTTIKTVTKDVAKEGIKGAGAQVIDNVIKGKKLTKDIGVSAVISSVTGNMKIAPNGKNAKITLDKATKKTTSNTSTGRTAGSLTKKEKISVKSANSQIKINRAVEATTSLAASTTNKKVRDEIDELK